MKSKVLLHFGCMAAIFAATIQPVLAQNSTAPIAISNDTAKVQQLATAILAALEALPAGTTKQDVQAQIAFVTASQPKAIVAGALRLLLLRPTLKVQYRNAMIDFIRLSDPGLTSYAGLTAVELPFLAAGPSINGGGTGVNYGQ